MSTLRDDLLAHVHEMKSFVRPDGSIRIAIRDHIQPNGDPLPYVEIARLGKDHRVIAFYREELRELILSLERARALLLGAQGPFETARVQEAAGMKPRLRKGRR